MDKFPLNTKEWNHIIELYHQDRNLPFLEISDLYFIACQSIKFDHLGEGQDSSSLSHCPSSDVLMTNYFICLICFDESQVNNLSDRCPNTFGISTQEDRSYHRGICHSCIELYLISSINSSNVSGNGSIRCICPDKTCNRYFDRDFILSSFENNAKLIRKYEQFTLNAFVEEDNQLRWCPRQGCGSVVTIPINIQHRSQIQCQNCGKYLCSSCGNTHSSLAPCSMGVEEDFLRWKNTIPSEGCRKCPSCRMYIEKNGGCRHIICSHCQIEFCWYCKSKWIDNRCSAGVLCQAKWFWQHPSWGNTLLQRGLTKTVSLPFVVTATGVCIGAAVAVGAICSPLMIVWCIQRYKRRRWIEQNQRHALDRIVERNGNDLFER